MSPVLLNITPWKAFSNHRRWLVYYFPVFDVSDIWISGFRFLVCALCLANGIQVLPFTYLGIFLIFSFIYCMGRELSLDEVELIPFMKRPSHELYHDNSSVMNYHLLKYLHIRIPFHSLQDKLTLSCHLNSQCTVHHTAPRGFCYKLQISSCFLSIVRICLNSASSQFSIGHRGPQRTSWSPHTSLRNLWNLPSLLWSPWSRAVICYR